MYILEKSYARILEMNLRQKVEEQLGGNQCGFRPKRITQDLRQIIETKMTYDTMAHLRRWADKFCLHCNIFIYIRHISIKPVLCSRMVSLFHHTSP